jgi:hypothetical protein
MTRRLPRQAASRTGLVLSLALVPLAALRATRFITKDWLGEWTIVKPLKTWATIRETEAIETQTRWRKRVTQQIPGLEQYELQQQIRSDEQLKLDRLRANRDSWTEYDEHYPLSWPAKLAHGLDCPFCVGFWLCAGILVAAVVCPKPLRPALNVLLGALGLNYVTGHVSSRLD